MEYPNLGPTSDFSPIAGGYDATRNIPEPLLKAAYERMIERGILPPAGLVLDAGCGTGQMSIVLADMGYDVRGYDVSPEMIAIARSKLRPGGQATYSVGDVRRLPDKDGWYDAVVLSKLLMHIDDWRGACRELLRVLRPGACMIEIFEPASYENGVRRHFASLADSLGHTHRFIGLDPRKRAELVAFLSGEGCERLSLDITDLKWEKPVRYGDILDHFRQRLLAEYWYLPDDAYDGILADTERWVNQRPKGPDEIEVMKPYLAAQVFRKL